MCKGHEREFLPGACMSGLSQLKDIRREGCQVLPILFLLASFLPPFGQCFVFIFQSKQPDSQVSDILYLSQQELLLLRQNIMYVFSKREKSIVDEVIMLLMNLQSCVFV